MIVSQLKQLARRMAILSYTFLVCTLSPAVTQTAGLEPPVPSGVWHSGQTTELIGLPEGRSNTKGSLTLSSDALVFRSTSGTTTIERAAILSIAAGSERKESGGTAGRISRAVIPFGGGSLMAATGTNKEVGLLTIEFRDQQHALHGAVFQMPKEDAVQAQERFAFLAPTAPAVQPQEPCHANGEVQADTLKIDALGKDGVEVPAEYRVLLYEQLVAMLREEKTFSAVYRDGENSSAAACSRYRLNLTLQVFTKGNAALRASTGPMGYFFGATSLKVHVRVQDQNGDGLLDKEVKVTQRGDTESLNAAARIAKALNKDLKKRLKAQRNSAALSK